LTSEFDTLIIKRRELKDELREVEREIYRIAKRERLSAVLD